MSKTLLNRFAILLFVAMASGNLCAQPNGYYNDAIGKSGDELRVALHNIIDEHTSISYQQIWTAFWSTDNKGNGVVWDIYSDIPNGTAPYTYQLGQNQCGEYEKEGDCYNREHLWPKSWLGGSEESVPGRDLHHIFPTDGYVNAERSNYPFGEVNSTPTTTTFQNGSKLGNCKSSLGYTNKVFEPIDDYKGDIARALMYMSVRYYGEDDDWGTSGMTNKSEILPWALTMLLRWSDQDPVSQKEIDRNNAVYTIQHNRNPFIDHPEYARAIWDPNWHGVEYIVSYASVQHGSITGPSSAVEGTLVTLTATPAPGYMIDSWTVYKTGDPATTVTVSSNGTFTMPGFGVTVSATFVQNTTSYAINLGPVSHGSINASTSGALSGTNITLTATPANGYSLYAWYVYKTDDINTQVQVNTTGNTGNFVMPAYNVTVLASFAQGSGDGGYVKVTSAPSDWSGEYILVYENSTTQGYVWTGVDAANCYVSKTISNQTIADDDFVTLTLASMSGGYSIKVNGGANNGKYISGNANSNTISFGTTAKLNTLEFETTGIKITSNTSVMRYNKNSSDNRFRYYKSGSYTNQQPVQLYKKTEGSVTVPTHTIRFYPNGGSPSNYVEQTVTEYEPTALQANNFERAGYAFDSWNTATNGSGTIYFDGATVTLLNDLTLYAQWVPTFTINCNQQVANGSISASVSEAVEGAIVTLTATPNSGYDLEYWTVTDANNEPIVVEGNQFVMPASNVTVSAVFTYVGQSYVQKYYLVTDASQLVVGRTYLVVCTTRNRAMGPQADNAYNRLSKNVTISNNSITGINGASELTLGSSAGLWTLSDGTGFLCAASSTNNQLMTQTELDNNGRWSIEITNNEASIVAQGDYTHNIIRYSSNGGYFGCFNSGATAVSLFVRSEEYDYTESTTVPCLNTFDKTTIRSGVTLSADVVMGASMCNNAMQLVLEDGAQLMHNTTGINATMKKAITAYTGDGGWYTVGVPFTTLTPSANNGLLADNYDLYYYNEIGDNQGQEWINYKSGAFNLTSGKGYLYANDVSRSLRLTGTLNIGNYSPTVNLSYASSDDVLKGFNLLSNPTAHEIEFSKTANVSDGYYYLNNSETWVYTTATTVPVGRGFLVKANDANQSVVLNPQGKGSREAKGQYICVGIGEEKVFVKLNEGVSMPLANLREQHSSLYLMRNRQPYVMLVRGDAATLDLCYEVRSQGKQTLKVDTQGLSLDYLHLVDHITGADIDLLATPEYTFNAQRTDYAARFQLVFVVDGNASTNSTDAPFAYFADGHIVVDYDGEATLQVIDMLGRMVNRDKLTPGVYVLRLITDDAVRVQKIEVR